MNKVAVHTLTMLTAALLLSLSGQVSAAAPDCSAPERQTSSGTVCGTNLDVAGTPVHAYLGMPYGEDTGGDNRFAAPQPGTPWDGVFTATEPGDACPQVPLAVADGPGGPESEDCLALNVWTPDASGEEEPLPVLVFIHGGGFLVGTATDAPAAPGTSWYNLDGRFLAAEHGLVVVSFNYRLGAFGFLGGLPDFAGNYGILDQQLALEWVQDNIAAFGGDPGNVTLMGESGGGTSVAVHAYSAPDSAGLFRRAIIESNPAGFGVYEPGEARGQAERFLRATGCLFNFNRPRCLRSKPLAELIDAQRLTVDLPTVLDRGIHSLVTWLPTVDGTVLERQPLLGALDGTYADPLLVGTNEDEAFSFLGQFINEETTPFVGSTAYRLLFGRRVWEMIDNRYVKQGDRLSEALLAGAGDYLFTCPAQLAAAAAPRGYHYRFRHVPEYVGGLTGGETCTDKSCHAVELPYIFGTGRFENGFSTADAAVSETMMNLWADFAHGKADSGGSFDGWRPAIPANGGTPTRILQEPVSTENFSNATCELWEGVYRDAYAN